jgi:hypothetical protein
MSNELQQTNHAIDCADPELSMPLFAKFLGLGWQEWTVIGIIAVLLFGRRFWRMRRG